MRGLNKVTLIGNLGKDPDIQVLSSRAEVTVVCQTARHSELAEESRSRQQAARMNRARFLGKLGMTFFFIRLLVRDNLDGNVPVAKFSLATSETYRDKSDQLKTRHHDDAAGTRHYVTEIVGEQLLLLPDKKPDAQ